MPHKARIASGCHNGGSLMAQFQYLSMLI